MKIPIFVFLGLLLAGSLIAQQNVTVIEGGADKGGLLEATINGDTTENGERINPNQIYELEANAVYYQHGPILVNNPGGVITIRGEKGGAKPVVIKKPLDETPIGQNVFNSSLTLLNVQYENMQTDSVVPLDAFVIEGDNHRLDVEDCLIENCFLSVFNMKVTTGAKIILQGNYFRDMNDFSQWWGARAVECKYAIDSLVIDNNTFTGAGLLFLCQESVIDVAIINHNTIINNHKYPFLNQYWRECYFTNNLFVNANMVGEDYENVATGGQDPDALLQGIFGVDSIRSYLNIQPKFLINDNTLTADIDNPDDYIIYVADNVVTYSADVLDAYYNGIVDGVFGDAPTSYLTWGGFGNGPWKVVNVPAIWQNVRTEALVADYPNIREENNSIYTMSMADLGIATDPLPQAAANLFIQWNRANWAVPDVTAPADYTAYYFGDHDPGTIPGVETENSATGITKICDLIEDFSYTADLTSHCDCWPIGSLVWTNTDYDPAASLQAIKHPGMCGPSPVKPLGANENLNVYPNPVKSFLYVKDAKNADLTVRNMDGRIVKEIKNAPGVSVSDLTDGMYTVTIRKGNRISTQKIIISKD